MFWLDTMIQHMVLTLSSLKGKVLKTSASQHHMKVNCSYKTDNTDLLLQAHWNASNIKRNESCTDELQSWRLRLCAWVLQAHDVQSSPGHAGHPSPRHGRAVFVAVEGRARRWHGKHSCRLCPVGHWRSVPTRWPHPLQEGQDGRPPVR